MSSNILFQIGQEHNTFSSLFVGLLKKTQKFQHHWTKTGKLCVSLFTILHNFPRKLIFVLLGLAWKLLRASALHHIFQSVQINVTIVSNIYKWFTSVDNTGSGQHHSVCRRRAHWGVVNYLLHTAQSLHP